VKGTRIFISNALNKGKYLALLAQAKLLGVVRSEVWQRFGSINGASHNYRCIRTDWVKSHDFSPLFAKAWKETLRDGLNDIRLYEAACKAKVRKQIHARFKDESKRKEYFGKLKYDQWVNDPLLCRWMRKVNSRLKFFLRKNFSLENTVKIIPTIRSL